MSAQQKSLILVTVDCLRADHCGFYGYQRPTTPFLDTMAAESVVVPTAVIAGAPTYYSFPAILASRMPLALGRDVIGLAPGENTLAAALREAGYATAAFSAANPYISQRFGYGQGFDVFQDFLDFDPPPNQVGAEDSGSEQDSAEIVGARGRINRALKRAAHAAGLGHLYDDLYFEYCIRIAAPPVDSMDALRKFPSAEAIVEHATVWLSSVGPRPFFLWLHLMDPHSPYYPSPAAFQELTGRPASPIRARYLNEFWNRSDLTVGRLQSQKESVVELYDAGIRSVDSQVAKLVCFLKQAKRWDDCTFVLTADHGEEFLDHGRRYHAPVSLHEEIAHVPLLIRVPDATKKEVPAAPFSHLNLAPTLLEILGVPAPQSFQGTSRWCRLQQAAPSDDPVITECVYGCTNPFRSRDRMGARLLSIRNSRYKLVIRVAEGTGEDMYDLEMDPTEQRPMRQGEQNEVRKRLLQAACVHMQKMLDGTDARAPLRARMRDLRIELQSNSR
ncbi:MAG: sulfatase-like hydrolase/transferase [Terriglobales bacterium]|jgi:arylsulfatase A-like enzyme